MRARPSVKRRHELLGQRNLASIIGSALNVDYLKILAKPVENLGGDQIIGYRLMGPSLENTDLKR